MNFVVIISFIIRQVQTLLFPLFLRSWSDFFFACIFCPFSSSSVFLNMASGGEGSSGPVISHTNRLAKERSPYLLQHAHNPVDWWVPLPYTFQADVVHANVLCCAGIRGDKRLLTKRGMKISRSFYQVRHAPYWPKLFVRPGMFSVSLPLSEPQWATPRATGVTLWKGSLLKMKKLAKS